MADSSSYYFVFAAPPHNTLSPNSVTHHHTPLPPPHTSIKKPMNLPHHHHHHPMKTKTMKRTRNRIGIWCCYFSSSICLFAATTCCYWSSCSALSSLEFMVLGVGWWFLANWVWELVDYCKENRYHFAFQAFGRSNCSWTCSSSGWSWNCPRASCSQYGCKCYSLLAFPSQIPPL